MKIFISVAASKVKNLPKSALALKAKAKFDLGDAKHESTLKKGETFHLYTSGGKFFLFDTDEETGAFYKFEITKHKYNKLMKDHGTARAGAVSKVRTKDSGKQATKSLKARTNKAMVDAVQKINSVRDQRNDLLSALDRHILLTKAVGVQTDIQRVLVMVEDYNKNDVVFTPAADEFIEALLALGRAYRKISKDDKDGRASFIIEQVALLEKQFNIKMSGNPLVELQKRRNSKAPVLQFPGRKK